MSDLFKGFFRDKPGNTPRTTGGAYTIDERDKVQALKRTDLWKPYDHSRPRP